MNKILIIEDEKETVNMLKGFLEARGYMVVAAFDGEEGLKKFDSEKPDLVITDIRMPKKDGYQFLKELRPGRRWVPVIIVSGLNDLENILKSYDFEADFYITKPINLEDMLKAIKILLSLSPLRKTDNK